MNEWNEKDEENGKKRDEKCFQKLFAWTKPNSSTSIENWWEIETEMHRADDEDTL